MSLQGGCKPYFQDLLCHQIHKKLRTICIQKQRQLVKHKLSPRHMIKKFQLVRLLLPSVYKLGKRHRPAKWLVPSVTTNKEDGEKQHVSLDPHKRLPNQTMLSPCRRSQDPVHPCEKFLPCFLNHTHSGCQDFRVVLATQEGHIALLPEMHCCIYRPVPVSTHAPSDEAQCLCSYKYVLRLLHLQDATLCPVCVSWITNQSPLPWPCL